MQLQHLVQRAAAMQEYHRMEPRYTAEFGNVAFTRHAVERMAAEGISEETIDDVLANGRTIPDGRDHVWKQGKGIRIVILLHPTPPRGAVLVKTVFKEQAAALARR